jgi:hypothetical protein
VTESARPAAVPVLMLSGEKITTSHLGRDAYVYLLSELGGEFPQFKGGSWCAGLRSFVMIGQDEPRDLPALVVPQAGWLEHVKDPWEPCRLRDPVGTLVGPVPNPVTGKAPPGRGYAPATAAYGESVLRGFTASIARP